MILSIINIVMFLFASVVLTMLKVTRRSLLAIFVAATFLFSLAFVFDDIVSSLSLGKLYYSIRSVTYPMHILLVTNTFSLTILFLSLFIIATIMIFLIYMEKQEMKFLPHLFLLALAINVITLTGDIFNTYVFFELLCVSSYVLIAMSAMRKSLVTAYNYLVIGSVGTLLVLLGVFIYLLENGTLMITPTAIPDLAMIFLFVGFGVKAAYIPLQWWKPDILSSVTLPIAALFSGVIALSGVYTIIKILSVTYFNTLFIAIALITMIFAALFALVETRIPRIFAYGSICQIGYIFLGFGLGTILAVTGSIFHIITFVVSTTALFLILSAAETYGMNRVFQICFVLNMLSLVGIPPLAGFFSKLPLYVAALNVGHPEITFTALAVSTLTLVYYIKTFASLQKGKVKVPPLSLLSIILLLTSIIVIFGIFPNIPVGISDIIAKNMLGV